MSNCCNLLDVLLAACMYTENQSNHIDVSLSPVKCIVIKMSKADQFDVSWFSSINDTRPGVCSLGTPIE